jgi:mannose-6-phosphate isomerase-like protein (cupin superfamily)
MAGKREKPEDIVSKLRQVEVLQGQGMTISQAVRDYILILANTGKYRSEHWIVIEGTARVQIGGDTKLIKAGESVFAPLGAVHRKENPMTFPMVLIEVQLGTYLGEDEIIRYEDFYFRG